MCCQVRNISEVIFKDLGKIDFKKAWEYQEKLFEKIVSVKGQNRDLPPGEQIKIKNHLLFCEHPHVYTLGKSGSENNLLIDQLQLKAKDASFYKINRGGDITYHGPGQIVGYPIFDLELFNVRIKQYINKLEEAIIKTLSIYNLKGERLKNGTGVWLDPETPGKARKICAIGVRASRFVTMHGFAFNVNTNLEYFNYINPCGFVDKGITSLEKEVDAKIDINNVKLVVREKMNEVFEFDKMI
ncbi:MAG: lipoyl(octanoyl) transferase LipB [Bacteroidetes bacterium]|nr:lipoyl(octanoyl) transferase LipB [Bacteroidota bacterium]